MSKRWSEEADTCDEFVQSAYEEYSVDTVAELLLPTGLLIDKSTQYVGSFEKYVFLVGDNDEVYSKREIDFISGIENIAVFTEIYKKTKRGVIPCKVIAVKNTGIYDAVSFSVAFIKIFNKASNSFNICVTVSDEGVIFACRAYEQQISNAYCISDIIKREQQLEELAEGLMFSPDYDEFVEYYSYVKEIIRYSTEKDVDLFKSRETHRIPYAYIDELHELEVALGLDFSREIEKCFWRDIAEYKESYADRVSEADKYLFKIESTKVNTMEMLFEAEKMEKLASEDEQRNENLLMQNKDFDGEDQGDMDEETRTMLDDPEAMIKMLKKQRGI